MRVVRETARLIFSLVLSSSLAGCATDYPAVATLSTTMQKSIDAWRPFVADYAATCRRRSWYDPNVGGSQDSCSDFDVTQTSLSQDIDVLSAYFGALSAIATDSNYAIDGGVKGLADAVAGADTADKAKISAAGALAAPVAGWITSGVRRHSLTEAASHAGDAKKIVAAITTVIDDRYRKELGLEAKQWRDDVKGAASNADATARLINKQPGLIGLPIVCSGKSISWNTPSRLQATADQLMFQHFYVDRCNSILQRQTALDAFKSATESLNKGLDQLATSPFPLKDKAFLQQLFAQAKTLYDQTNAVKQAFNGNSTTTGGAVANTAPAS